MTPKEKANNLCYEFMICNSYQSIVWHNAKICALIAVNEIIKEHFGDDSEYGKRRYYYFKEVKQEIQIL
jgi:hypothetical protein